MERTFFVLQPQDEYTWQIASVYQPFANMAFGRLPQKRDAWLVLDPNRIRTEIDFDDEYLRYGIPLQDLMQKKIFHKLVAIAQSNPLKRTLIAGHIVNWLLSELSPFHDDINLNDIPQLVEKQVINIDTAAKLLTDKPLSLKQKTALAGALYVKPELSQVFRLAGRYTRDAQAIKAKLPKSENFGGFEQGNKVHRALTSELSLLSLKQTVPLFTRKIVDKQLLQTKRFGTENLSKGPIIVAIDVSPSMDYPISLLDSQQLTRDVWAKAIALALLQVAKAEERTLDVILYSSPAGASDGALQYTFLNGRLDVDKAIDVLIARPEGRSTEYVPALKRVLNGLNKQPQADVLWVTDGAPQDLWRLNRFLEKFNQDRGAARVFGISIGQVADILQKFCDVTVEVNNSSTAETITQQLLSHIIK